MRKKICCSIILAVIVYFFTMMLCTIYTPYPDLMSMLVGYYSILMAVIAFIAYGDGESKKGNKFLCSIFWAIVIFLFTILLTIFVSPYEEFLIKMAIYYAVVAFVVAFISYVLGSRTKKNK